MYEKGSFEYILSLCTLRSGGPGKEGRERKMTGQEDIRLTVNEKMAVILLHILHEKGLLNDSTFDSAMKIYLRN